MAKDEGLNLCKRKGRARFVVEMAGKMEGIDVKDMLGVSLERLLDAHG